MREFAEEAIRSGKEVNRLQVLGEGVKAAFKNLEEEFTQAQKDREQSQIHGFGLQPTIFEVEPLHIER